MGHFHLVEINKTDIMVSFFLGWFMTAACVRMSMKACTINIKAILLIVT